MRRRRGEKLFLFDAALTRVLAEVERQDWEFAVGVAGGGVAEAARVLEIDDVPSSAKALWGRSAFARVRDFGVRGVRRGAATAVLAGPDAAR